MIHHIMLPIAIQAIRLASRMSWANWFLRCQRLLPHSDGIAVRSLFLARELASWVFGLVLLQDKTTCCFLCISRSCVGTTSSLSFRFFNIAIIWVAIVIEDILCLVILIWYNLLIFRISYPSCLVTNIGSTTDLLIYSQLLNSLWSCRLFLLLFFVILAHSSNDLSTRFIAPSFGRGRFFRILAPHGNRNFLRQLFGFDIISLIISFLATLVVTDLLTITLNTNVS